MVTITAKERKSYQDKAEKVENTPEMEKFVKDGMKKYGLGESEMENKIDLLFERVNVKGMKREEASPDPKRIEADGGKLTKKYKEEVQQEVDKNTDILLKELDGIINDFEVFRAKYKKLHKEEGERRRGESALRFGGRWKKMGTVYNNIEDMVVTLRKLRDNF